MRKNCFSKKKNSPHPPPPPRKFEGALFNINFFNVENSIKREMRKNTFSKKKKINTAPSQGSQDCCIAHGQFNQFFYRDNVSILFNQYPNILNIFTSKLWG